MKLLYEPVAAKRLASLQPKAARKMRDRLEAIAVDPFAAHANVERLKGEVDTFRLRQGDWRAVYWIDRTASEMRVLKIGPRGEVYGRGAQIIS